MLVIQQLRYRSVWRPGRSGVWVGPRREGLVVDIVPGEAASVVFRAWMGFGRDWLPEEVSREIRPGVAGSVDALQVRARPKGHYAMGMGTPDGGHPKREPVPIEVALAPGQFVRWLINARFYSSRDHWYIEDVYNVTCGDEIPPDRFLMPPERVIDLRLDLR